MEQPQNLPTPIPSKTGLTGQVATAFNQPRIRDLGQNAPVEIKKLLGQLFILTGLRKENFPDELQTGILIQFIFEDLGQYTLEEIKLAFRMAVKGDLNVEANHYQSFSAPYIASIVSGYVQVRTSTLRAIRANENALKIDSKMEHTDQEKKTIRKDYILTCILKPYQYFLKTGGLTFGITPMSIIYKTLTEDLKLLVVEPAKKKEMYAKAVEMAKKSLSKPVQNLEEHRALKSLKEKVEKEGIEKALDMEIKSFCYEMAVKEYFTQCKQDGIDLEALILPQL